MASLGRLFHILLVIAGHAVSRFAPWIVRRSSLLERHLPSTELSQPERLKAILESLGGSFVKLGQMLALQPDILPMEYCNALYSLLDRVHPVPYDQIEGVFVGEIGTSPIDTFESFDKEAIASGSIGQVHTAIYQGRKVAVKVQRPDTEAGFHRDVKLMRACLWIVQTFRIKPLYWMIDPLTEFSAWTIEELDFRREARYMDQLCRNAEENATEHVPAIISDFCTRRVLVVEFLEGITLIDHMRALDTSDEAHQDVLRSMNFDPEQFAEHIIDNCLGDVFRYGLFHADLHPANLMILPDNVVGYIDFGITGVISQYSRQNLLAMTLAYARKDIESMCDRFFDVSSLDENSDPEGFRQGLKKLSEGWYRTDTQPDKPRLGVTTTIVMLDMLTLSREHGVFPQRDVIKYIRCAIAIDGLIRQFAPGFNVSQHLASTCFKFLTGYARRSLFSHDAMINWFRASSALVRHGAFRMSDALEQVGSRSTADRTGGRRDQSVRVKKLRRIELAAVFAACIVLAFSTDPSATVGFNLFTAQLAVGGAAGFLLLKTLWRSPVPVRGG